MLGLIIYGTRGVTYNKAKGTFFCPACRAQVPYAHKRVRRFFTLYFIPLIPLDKLGEHIECQQCKGTFRMEVLQLALGPGGPPQGQPGAQLGNLGMPPAGQMGAPHGPPGQQQAYGPPPGQPGQQPYGPPGQQQAYGPPPGQLGQQPYGPPGQQQAYGPPPGQPGQQPYGPPGQQQAYGPPPGQPGQQQAWGQQPPSPHAPQHPGHDPHVPQGNWPQGRGGGNGPPYGQ